MDDGFDLPVKFKGKELIFPSKLHLYGYTQKIEAYLNGTSVIFERDEEREWRAIIDASEVEKDRSINIELLQAIVTSVEKLLS